MSRFFSLTAYLAFTLTACDPDAGEPGEVQVVAVGEPAAGEGEDRFVVLTEDACSAEEGVGWVA